MKQTDRPTHRQTRSLLLAVLLDLLYQDADSKQTHQHINKADRHTEQQSRQTDRQTDRQAHSLLLVVLLDLLHQEADGAGATGGKLLHLLHRQGQQAAVHLPQAPQLLQHQWQHGRVRHAQLRWQVLHWFPPFLLKNQASSHEQWLKPSLHRFSCDDKYSSNFLPFSLQSQANSHEQHRTDLGKRTHQCNETQWKIVHNHFRQKKSSLGVRRETTKEEGSKEEDRREAADVKKSRWVHFPRSVLFCQHHQQLFTHSSSHEEGLKLSLHRFSCDDKYSSNFLPFSLQSQANSHKQWLKPSLHRLVLPSCDGKYFIDFLPSSWKVKQAAMNND